MNEDNLLLIGQRFKELRLAKGWSQETCARKLGYSNKTSISKIELGVQGIRRSQIEHVCQVLGTTPAYLMGWKEEPTLPGNPTLTGLKAEIVELVASMPEDKQKLLLELIKSMKNGR